jgi:hypothetical protein
MARSSWAELTADLTEADVALLSAYRERALALGDDVEERVHRTEIVYARLRYFTTGFIKGHRLEIAIDLLRPAPLPRLRQAFPSTQRVLTHRVWVDAVEQLDDLADALRESYDTVGPGVH